LKSDDSRWIKIASALAKTGAKFDEVPVGAILIDNEQHVLASAFNCKEAKQDPLGHAEILAIRDAATILNAWRLTDTTLYVTLEPCLMCAGAIIQARIPRVVFGAYDPKGGAFGSTFRIHEASGLNHSVEVQGGVLQEECSEILQVFFRRKRVQD
jgi:tRNA(adenine34) deaminase